MQSKANNIRLDYSNLVFEYIIDEYRVAILSISNPVVIIDSITRFFQVLNANKSSEHLKFGRLIIKTASDHMFEYEIKIENNYVSFSSCSADSRRDFSLIVPFDICIDPLTQFLNDIIQNAKTLEEYDEWFTTQENIQLEKDKNNENLKIELEELKTKLKMLGM